MGFERAPTDATPPSPAGEPPRGIAASAPVARALEGLAGLLRRRWNAIAVAIYLGFVVVVAGLAATVTDLNYDVLPYTAVALEDRATSVADLHAKTYAMVREKTDEAGWRDLTEGHPIRLVQYEHPEKFVSHLGMYRVKFLYVKALAALTGVMNSVTAAKIINVAAFLLLAGAVFVYMRHQGAVGALPFAAFVMLALGTLHTAIAPLPDTLSAAFCVAGLLFFAARRPWLAGAVLILAALTRTDNVIVMFALVLASLLYGYGRIAATLAFAAALALVLKIAAGAGHPGWWPHFYTTVVEMQEEAGARALTFDPVIYVKTLIEQSALAFYGNTFASVAILSALTWAVLAARGLTIPAPARAALLAALLAILGKFVVFPMVVDRVYYAQCIVAVVVLLAAARPTLALPPAPSPATR